VDLDAGVGIGGRLGIFEAHAAHVDQIGVVGGDERLAGRGGAGGYRREAEAEAEEREGENDSSHRCLYIGA